MRVQQKCRLRGKGSEIGQGIVKSCPDIIHDSRRAYQTWRARYIEVYEKFVPSTCLPSCRVKIAILDTGVDMTHPDMMARAERIKAKYNLVNPKARHVHDRTGHGTFAAGLILDFAPDADIYIAKIAENEPCSPETIAEVSLC